MKRSKEVIRLLAFLAVGALLWVGLTYLADNSSPEIADIIGRVIGGIIVLVVLWFSGLLPSFIHWVKTKLKK